MTEYVDANSLVIIGLDTKDDDSHPLYDERIKLPVNQERVANVMEYGILEPVVVLAGTMNIIMGRQRIRWAREANARFAKMSATLQAKWIKEHGDDHPNVHDGKVFVRIPFVEKKLSDLNGYGAMIAENEVRTKDNTMVAARKMETFVSVAAGDVMDKNPETSVDDAYDAAYKKAALAFGCSLAKIKQYLKLLDLAPEVQAKVETGELAAYEVMGLRDLSPEDQKEAADKKAKNKKEGKKEKVEGDTGRQLRVAKTLIRKVAAQLGGVTQIALLWSMGEIDEAAACETKEFAKALAATRTK